MAVDVLKKHATNNKSLNTNKTELDAAPSMCISLFEHIWSDLDLLTSKSNQFIFVHKCTKIVNFAKFIQMVYVQYRVC